jgi:hypothetical protein
MCFFILRKSAALLCTVLIILVVIPQNVIACGCGCNVFSVGNKWMMAASQGFKLSFQYSYMDQNRNWNGLNTAPAYLNEDREVRTSFYTFGLQYMADREWGVMVETPMWNRYFSTFDDGSLSSVDHLSFGDIRITGIYTGLSEDMSTAILLGVKLPTGSINQTLFDRDTQIGTGTTDLLLGGYRMGQETMWGWFTQVLWQHALNSKDDYKPGDSFDANIGFHYDRWVNSLSIVPMLEAIGSFRGSDSGIKSHPEDTGYKRLFIAPGFEFKFNYAVQFYADIRIPVLTNVNGNQLVAPTLINASADFSF